MQTRTLGLFLILMVSSVTAAQSKPSAVLFDLTGMSFEEQCTALALQGLANREAPRLFFRHTNRRHSGSDNTKWAEIYREQYGMEFEPMTDLSALLDSFRDRYTGLIVYDPTVDGSRWVAMSFAGAERLLPVCPTLLSGWSGRMTGRGNQPSFDFAQNPEGIAGRWQGVRPDAVVAGEGLRLATGDRPSRFVSYGPFTVDLRRYPFLTVEIGHLQGEGARGTIKLVRDTNRDGRLSTGDEHAGFGADATGRRRWHVPDRAGLQGEQTFLQVQLHAIGRGAEVVWRRLAFEDEAGRPAPTTKPVPLTERLGCDLRHDLRGRFARSVEAYEWALEHVLPLCDRGYAHTPAGPDVDGLRVGMGPFRDFDWTVQHRGFFFNLTHITEDKNSFGTIVDGDERQAALYRRILERLRRPAFILGYGEPEMDWFRLVGAHGHRYVHWGDNLSFHCRVPQKPLRQKQHVTPASVKPETDKYYVCFVMSEGDTFKGPLTFFFDSWFDPARGSVPMNWAVPPCFGRFPGVADYFYRTATSNDYFVATQVFNHAMPNPEQLAHVLSVELRQGDLRVLSGAFGEPQDISAAFVKTINPIGFFDAVHAKCPYAGYQKLLEGGVPLVGTAYLLSYWGRLFGGWGKPWARWIRTPAKRTEVIEKLTAEIRKVAGEHEPPFVVLVYTNLHNCSELCSFHRDVAAALDPSMFRVARLDEAFSAIRAWATSREE